MATSFIRKRQVQRNIHTTKTLVKITESKKKKNHRFTLSHIRDKAFVQKKKKVTENLWFKNSVQKNNIDSYINNYKYTFWNVILNNSCMAQNIFCLFT